TNRRRNGNRMCRRSRTDRALAEMALPTMPVEAARGLASAAQIADAPSLVRRESTLATLAVATVPRFPAADTGPARDLAARPPLSKLQTHCCDCRPRENARSIRDSS